MNFKTYDKINGKPVTAEKAEAVMSQILAGRTRAVNWGGEKRTAIIDVICNECGHVHPFRDMRGECCERCQSPDVSFDIEYDGGWSDPDPWGAREAKDWWDDAKARDWIKKIKEEEAAPKKRVRKPKPKAAPVPDAPKPDAPVIRRRIRWQ